MSEDILHAKQGLRDLNLSVREVHDRQLGTFEHTVNSLAANSFAIIEVPRVGDVGLISKARNYSTTPYDIMVSYLSEEISAVNQITPEQRDGFFTILADLHHALSQESGMQIVIGLNQHSNGFRLPERTPAGHKTRVQTLKPLHAHLYEVSAGASIFYRTGSLSREDQRDMFDPFLQISYEALLEKLGTLPIMGCELSLRSAPVGINIVLSMPLDHLLRYNAGLLSTIQNEAQAVYDTWQQAFSADNNELRRMQVAELLAASNFSEYSQRVLRTVALAMKPESMVKPDEVFVSGLAITYTLFQNQNGNAVISLHPRIMSHGNSADAFGLYVDNSEGEYADELAEKKALYVKLINELSGKYRITEGDFLRHE